ncbi:MAG: heat-inducible transcriptional repressor HrcA [Firmicutes bacterium]|nr:heat-inducible transcriptional repressor HrcA [Bacillota bacterium]
MASPLDERKKRILKVVTDDYIASAEPVGSRTIARRYDLGLSPATIRNEMSDLEESGYLEQPHTSAGRVPSERGYRYYVDALMGLQRLTDAEVELIYRELEQYQQEIESLIHQTSKVLAQLTKYPSMVLAPQIETAVCRHIQLVKLSETTVLVVIVVDTGSVENKIIELQSEISTEELDRLSVLLNEKLRGRSLADMRFNLLNEISSELVFQNQFFNDALRLLIHSMAQKPTERVYIDGATKILEQPEFADIQKFKPLMSLLEKEDRLYKLLSKSPTRKPKIKIGHENEENGMSDCSVVTASYEIAGRTVGVIGVLGPTRMEYSKVLPIVEYTANVLSELLTKANKRGLR